MIPPEAVGKLVLLVQASDADGTWSAGLLRADAGALRDASNRDLKRTLSERGRAAVTWLFSRSPLQENALVRMAERDVAAVFAARSGQQRVNELFRRAQGRRVSRTVVATVAMQDDYMKRVRAAAAPGTSCAPRASSSSGTTRATRPWRPRSGCRGPVPGSSSARGSRAAGPGQPARTA